VNCKEDVIMTTSEATDDAQVRALIENWAQAVRDKNIDALMSRRAPDLLLYDLAPPLLYRGADAYRKGLEEWFPTFRGPIAFEVRDYSGRRRGVQHQPQLDWRRQDKALVLRAGHAFQRETDWHRRRPPVD
jgi:ketosteroid isomerase-like protein